MTPRRVLAAAAFLCLAVVAAPSAASAATPLDDAPVPSLCGHPAGDLVDGVLPGIPENEGGVWLVQDKVVVGELAGGSEAELAAVVGCYRGGVGWPDNIVVYDASHAIIGVIELGEVTKGGRESVRRIAIRGGSIIVDVVNIARENDILCCGSGSARLRLSWDAADNRVEVASKRMYTERGPARRLLTAVRHRRLRAARRYATAAVVRELLALHRKGRLRLGKCYGPLSDEWWMQQEDAPQRGCVVGIDWRDSPYESAIALHMSKSGWNSWRATRVQGIAG